MDPSGTWSPYGQGKEEHKDWLSHVLLSPLTGGNTGQRQGTRAQQQGAGPKGFEAPINISEGRAGLLRTVSAIITSHFSEQSMTRKSHAKELH